LCSLVFLVACKTDAKPAEKSEGEPAAAPANKQARPAPRLPDQGGPAAEGSDDGQPRDWADPAQRDQMQALREQRRKEREAALDTNHDGVLSPEEKAQRVAPMFKRLDANGDGKLTPDEIASSDRRMAFGDPAALDTDKNGEISLVELEAAVTARREEMREKWKGRGRGAAGFNDQ
jgi:hypothetical protein